MADFGTTLGVKNATIKAKVSGQIVELMLKSKVDNIWYDKDILLSDYLTAEAEKLAALAGDGEGSVESQIQAAVDNLVAESSFETLKAIEEFIGAIPVEGEGEDAAPVAGSLIEYINMKAQAAEENANAYTDEQIGELGNKTEASEGVEAVPYATVKEYVDDKVSKVATDANGDMKYTNESGTTMAVGGIAKGTTFDNMDIKDIIENMLYPYVAITAGSLTISGGKTLEVGATASITSGTVTYTKGSKNCTKLEILDGSNNVLGTLAGTNVASGSTVTLDATETVSADVAATSSSATVSYKGRVTDAQGTTKTTGNVTYTFYRPYYVGNMDSIPTTADEITALTKKIEATPASISASTKANKYWVFAYPASYSDVKTTKGVLDANGFDVTSSLAKKSNITITCLDGKDVAYKVYVGLKGTADATFTVARS